MEIFVSLLPPKIAYQKLLDSAIEREDYLEAAKWRDALNSKPLKYLPDGTPII